VEKITIKPTFREIVLRGKPEEGHVDVFSYNYEENANGLGCLFIVGQVLPASDDTSYMINLISSLAKREYYANVDVIPKDAFSKTLKKINEVLQDFFRNKDLKINIGIFAISGENIFISHLGKFKILLIRENQNIDILNNINLFNKEHIQEKEFSNIISGKVMLKDKIFAFYPTRSFTTREKYIKQYLTKLSIAEFAEKMIEIKQANNNFSCASVHIEIDKHIEPIIIKNPQLQELQELNSLLPRSDIKPQAVLTKISNASKTKSSSAPIKELPNIRPIDNNQSSKNLSTTTNIDNQTLPDDIELKGENNGWKNNVSYPGTPNASALENNPPKSNQENNMESSTLIRPSEFSSAKKDNILDIILKKFKPSGVYIIGVGQSQSVFKNKLILSGALIAGIAVLLVIAKYTFAPTLPVPGLQNSEDKAITALLGQLNERLDSAKSYRDANNLFEARRLLYESLAMLDSSSFPDSEKIISVGQEALIILDQIDKATQVPTNYIDQISQEFGKSHLISAIKDKIIVYTANSNETKSGIVTQSVADGVKSTTKIASSLVLAASARKIEAQPHFLVSIK